jgi:hypothetical protein
LIYEHADHDGPFSEAHSHAAGPTPRTVSHEARKSVKETTGLRVSPARFG